MRPWTDDEMHRLRVLAKGKVSAYYIAKSLGRMAGSVKLKARSLGLTLYKRGEEEIAHALRDAPGLFSYSKSQSSAAAAARKVRQARTSLASDAPAWLRACLAICQCGLFWWESRM
jgi:hypothetical protein